MKRIAMIGLAFLLGACGSSSSPTVPTSSLTDTFNGTVNPNGPADVHPFTVHASNGSLTVTLTAAAPPAGVFLAVFLGTPNTDGTCQIISTSASAVVQASATPALSGTAMAGSFCVGVQDPGPTLIGNNLTVPVSYTVVVTHV